jgi:hypothetical protein
MPLLAFPAESLFRLTVAKKIDSVSLVSAVVVLINPFALCLKKYRSRRIGLFFSCAEKLPEIRFSGIHSAYSTYSYFADDG